MDNQDILDFANMVFSMEYGSIDFEELYPKAYSRECCHIPVHHTIIEEGKLKALLDIYPVTMKIRDSGMQIRAAYIGTVAVHPKSRKKGYMSELMKQAENDALKNGFDIMLVDGDRHRYSRYGFEKAGIKYNFNVCASSGNQRGPKYSFEEIDADSGYVPFMYGLYMKRNVTARTMEDFFFCLKSNLAATYAIIESGKPIGYINVSHDCKNILEFGVEKGCLIPEMIYGFMEELGIDEVGIAIGADEMEKINFLEQISSYYNMTASHMMKILRPEKTLAFLAAWKESEYGTSGVNADDIIRIWRELGADDKEKVSLLTTCRCFTEARKGKSSRLADVPLGWLPLPFFLPDADAF